MLVSSGSFAAQTKEAEHGTRTLDVIVRVGAALRSSTVVVGHTIFSTLRSSPSCCGHACTIGP